MSFRSAVIKPVEMNSWALHYDTNVKEKILQTAEGTGVSNTRNKQTREKEPFSGRWNAHLWDVRTGSVQSGGLTSFKTLYKYWPIGDAIRRKMGPVAFCWQGWDRGNAPYVLQNFFRRQCKREARRIGSERRIYAHKRWALRSSCLLNPTTEKKKWKKCAVLRSGCCDTPGELRETEATVNILSF